jgi:hypothetical protein
VSDPVFFYGLFMDTDVLREAGVAADDPVLCRVPGWRLQLGARATLVPDASTSTSGVAMAVSAGDREVLYARDGLRDYRPVSVECVPLDGGSPFLAVTYVVAAESAGVEDPAYARALADLRQRLGLER